MHKIYIEIYSDHITFEYAKEIIGITEIQTSKEFNSFLGLPTNLHPNDTEETVLADLGVIGAQKGSTEQDIAKGSVYPGCITS